MVYIIGGAGYSVPLGIFIAGVSVSAASEKLLPKWMIWFGFVLALFGIVSWLSLPYIKLLPFIPLTRFPGFIWFVIAGFILNKAVKKRST